MSLNGLGTTWPYLPLLTVSGSALIISQAGDAIVDLSGTGGSGGNPATWSQYPATQQVELGTQNLNDVGVLQCADSYSQNLFIGSPITASTNVGTALSDLFTGLGDTQTRLDQVQSGVWTYDPSGGPGAWYQYDAQTLSLSTVLAPLQLGAQAWLESVIPLVDSGVPVYVVVSQGNLSQRFTVNVTDQDPGVKYLLFTSATAAPAWVVGQPTQFSAYTVPLTVQRLNNVFYVAKNGSDTAADGRGSIAAPYLTIQAAINAAQAGALPSAANQCVILIAPGTYTENLTLTDGYTTLYGLGSNNSRNYNVKIAGSITVSATGANDLYNRIFSFENLLIASPGASITLQDTTLTTEHSIVATNCRFISNDRAFYQNAGGNTRNIFNFCYFGHENASGVYTNPLIEMAGASWLEAIQCEFYAQNTQADVIRFSGTSYPYKLGLCQITSSSASATANPIVRYSSTQTSVGSVGQCSFVYESPTNKTANSPTSTAWLFDTGSFVYPVATPVVTFIQNAFILNGLANTALPVIAKRSTTTGTPIVLSGAQIAAPTLASKIQGGGAIIHQQFNTVA